MEKLMPDLEEGFYFTEPNESVWALRPKSLRDALEEAKQINGPIWRDEKSGLPMHRHAIPSASNDGYDFDMPSPSRCSCGNKAYDIPLSAIQPTKGE